MERSGVFLHSPRLLFSRRLFAIVGFSLLRGRRGFFLAGAGQFRALAEKVATVCGFAPVGRSGQGVNCVNLGAGWLGAGLLAVPDQVRDDAWAPPSSPA